MQEGGKQDTLTSTVPSPDVNRQNVHMHRQDSMAGCAPLFMYQSCLCMNLGGTRGRGGVGI